MDHKSSQPVAAGQEGVTVLVPRVVAHHLDPHTGIPFMPHMAGYMAAAKVPRFSLQII